MGVIADMILAIAVVAVAAGAIAEFQFRVRDICASADGAAVGIVRLCRGSALTSGERNGLAGCRFMVDRPALAPQLCPPGQGQQIGYFAAKKQEIVQQADQREQRMGQQVDGIAHIKHIDAHHDQIEQRHDPRPDGNDKENKELTIRIAGGIGKHQAQVQVIGHVAVQIGKLFRCNKILANNHFLSGAENHGKNIHQHHTGGIEQIKLKGADGQFHRPSQPVEEIQEENINQGICAEGIGQQPADQPPDLPLQDFGFIKSQNPVQHLSAVNHGHDRYQSRAQRNVQHEIRNALIPVVKAKTLKLSAEIFQMTQLLMVKIDHSYHTSFGGICP